ncbi:MAG TPA: cyclase family protein [Thermoclostridium caenicola]|mgnify:FL=1|uniref:cyclase family protein n=1 Tax=Thermoclostridium caenicola TaxID=659425 RepID=UPI002B68A921|nr:cyclase family protein [Thermoclostridium caenicola]HOK42846.1 cyclase family protein [Thermoclostridium caenicola]HOL84996.1 cyclase family protein [Thermoclostridium caenicola]HOP72737.1 cyclase family protein [Thermoclostridium caenicola]HPO76709.1 cyclase family protein [Thermoclostridium caenicola]
MFEGRQVIDVTRKILSGMTVWPGDPGVLVERTDSISDGAVANVSRISLGVHSGTHMDAPLHFIDGGKDIDSVEIARLFGCVLVVEAPSDRIGEELLEPYDLSAVQAVFFRTRASMRDEMTPFWDEYPAITAECAEYLIQNGIVMVGTDYFSVELCRDNLYPVHKTLLSHGIAIVENLALKDVEPGMYDYICLPLRIAGSDGSPVRVLLFR